MARPSATERVGRILAIVPWIAERGTARIDDVCERFDVSRRDLLADLEVVPFVGRYPYTPDNLISVLIDDEYVEIDYGNYFERPLRLTREEALGLLAAGQAHLTVSSSDAGGALARGLSKIADALGVDLDDDLRVVLSGTRPEFQDLLEQAIDAHHVVDIEHFSFARNELTRRSVEPRRMFNTDGAWYLEAFCRLSAADRVFRLDRIVHATDTGEGFDPRTPERTAPSAEGFQSDPDLPRVTLDLTRNARWVAEQYPVHDVMELDGGGIRVTLAVTGTPWLARLLLQLGPDAEVVEGPDEYRTLAADTATALLAIYD